MTRIGQEMKGGGRPQLKPSNCNNADLVVATIAAVEIAASQFKRDPQPVLTFKEDSFAEFQYRCGKRSVTELCNKFGDETDKWIGEKIPLIKRFEQMAKNQGGDGYVYQVPPVAEWAALLKRARKS